MKYEERIQQYSSQREKELEELISIHKKETDANLKAIKMFHENLPAFNECLIHFNINPIKKVETYSLSIEEGRATTSLSCPVNSKFKFISFKGYDARGRGKNHNQLISKAEKIENHFLEKGFRIGINYYSLESDKNEKVDQPKRVLIQWQIRF